MPDQQHVTIADIADSTAPRVRVELKYNGTDITANIAPFLQSFSYVDHAGSRADEIELQLENLDKLWGGRWYPAPTDTIQADIVTYDWEKHGQVQRLPCGVFQIDGDTFDGPPDGTTLKAISAPLTSGLRRQRKHRAWEHLHLRQIAADIADNAGLKLFYDAPINPIYDRKDQHFQSDLAFLLDLCNRYALRLKVTADRILIFDEATYEARPASYVLDRAASLYTRYAIRRNFADAYRACTVNYHGADAGQYITATFTAPQPPPTGEVLEINERVENPAEALLLAKARLREKNREAHTAEFGIPFNVHLVGAATVDLVNWGARNDGRYMVDSVRHALSSGGSTSEAQLHEALIGY